MSRSQAPKPLTGRKVFFMLVAFFGVVIGEGWRNSTCGFLVPGCSWKVDFNQAFMSFSGI